VKEEVGIDIEVLYPFNLRHFVREDGQTITMLIFLCKTPYEEIKISEEHSEYEWLDLNISKEKLNKYFHEDVDIFRKIDLGRLI